MVQLPSTLSGKYVRLKGQEEDRYCWQEHRPDDSVVLRHCMTRQRLIKPLAELEYATPPEHVGYPRISFRDWEYLVFVNAQHYRCCWKGDRRMHGENFATFPEAVAEGKKRRSIVAAVTATGRHIPFGWNEWDKWMAVWESLPGVKEANDE
jgi:hypothetical protein